MSRLSDKTVFEGDEYRSEESGGCPTFQTAHCEIRERNGGDTQDGGKHSHCNIWYVFIDPAITGVQLIILTTIANVHRLTWKSP